MVKHHGVHFLDKKQTKLKITETNKNDTREILGPHQQKVLLIMIFGFILKEKLLLAIFVR